MILPVISDIHSNLDALEMVLEKIDSDKIMCCGDIVGYYTQPNECIEKLRPFENRRFSMPQNSVKNQRFLTPRKFSIFAGFEF